MRVDAPHPCHASVCVGALRQGDVGIEQSFPQREIAQASYEYQRAVERGEKLVVGVNAFQSDAQDSVPRISSTGAVIWFQMRRWSSTDRPPGPPPMRT